MKHWWFRVKTYLRYWWNARTKYSIHSPFVYQLVTEVFEDDRYFYGYETAENLRQEMLSRAETLKVEDHGAGSYYFKEEERTICDVARYTAVAPKYGRLLFRLGDHFEPATIVELGTGLGLSTVYLASARQSSRVITIEGSSALAQQARQNFEQRNLSNIVVKEGTFREKLPKILQDHSPVDFMWIDGHHEGQALLEYFEMGLTHFHNESVLVIDDIYYSPDVREAWETIKDHPEVNITIDLYEMGIVFFRQEQAKEHFILRF